MASRNITAPMVSSGPTSELPNHRTLIIALSTVFSFIFVALLAITVFCMYRYRPFSRYATRRGATPIGDDEIATWRSKAYHHRESSSIVFSPSQPSPITPPPLARAPNARTGLTDASIPGDEPYLKRQSTRLSKSGQSHRRSKSRRSSVGSSTMDVACDEEKWRTRSRSGSMRAERPSGSITMSGEMQEQYPLPIFRAYSSELLRS